MASPADKRIKVVMTDERHEYHLQMLLCWLFISTWIRLLFVAQATFTSSRLRRVIRTWKFRFVNLNAPTPSDVAPAYPISGINASVPCGRAGFEASRASSPRCPRRSSKQKLCRLAVLLDKILHLPSSPTTIVRSDDAVTTVDFKISPKSTCKIGKNIGDVIGRALMVHSEA